MMIRFPFSKLGGLLQLVLLAVMSAAAASYDRLADPHRFTVFMREAGWCWFQDPRAVIHRHRLFLGSVQGNGSGPAQVGIYDLKAGRVSGRVLMQDGFNRDDHNAPAFFVRPDGSVLSMYALHHRNKTHYFRISDPDDYFSWSDEQTFVHDYPGADNVTYMNLLPLTSEGKLYNFFRGLDFNPSFITSVDDGLSWGEPTHFLRSEVPGRQRPYPRYAGNGVDTIALCFTDAHPRQFGNSIYYAAFRAGNFWRANGELIKNLRKEGPLKPSEADQVFRGGGQGYRGADQSALNSAWTSSIVLDKQQRPHLGYTLYLSNTDHRYRMAFWDGGRWMDRQVAYGGSCLYDRESSYTGLITLDPEDPTQVLISTDVDPTTGEGHGGNHEIYRAKVGAEDDISTIAWEPLTRHSPVRNLRPIIVVKNGLRVMIWLRGDFRTYTDYQLDAVGIVERAGRPE